MVSVAGMAAGGAGLGRQSKAASVSTRSFYL